MTPAYLARLQKGNIGVALGKRSGGLCVIDFDRDGLDKDFLTLNAHLKHTLQTHGARGRSFWIRFKGPYPERTRKLKSNSGEDLGEFRSNGTQSIVWGVHPNGDWYMRMMERPALVVDFASIKWPAEIANPPRIGGCTEETEEAEEAEETKEAEEAEVIKWVFAVKTIEQALAISTPTRVHENNALLFTLARAVKALEEQETKFKPAQLKDIFQQWYARSVKFLRPGQTKEDYMIEFMKAYQRAKYPLGSVIIPKAWKLAQEQPLPPEAAQFEEPKRQLLVALCKQLQILAGNEPFYLSARTVQGLFKQESHSTAATWLQAFCTLQIIKKVQQGNTKRATRYKYITQP